LCFQDKLYQEDYQQVVTEEDKEKISAKLSEASEWMDEEGYSATTKQLREKLTGRRYGVPLQLSHREVIATGGHRSAFFVKLPSFHSGDTE